MEKAIRRKAARVKQSVEEVVDASESEDERIETDITGPIDRSMLIPTGSTLLNLALSDDPYGGFALGTINNIIGDSAAGKTFLFWTMLAEMTYDERFSEHELIYDEPEAAFAFNISKLFGQAVEDRVNTDTVSDSVEDWHDNVFAKVKENVPFIYGLDSLDAISSEEEIERDIRKGTFGAAKPKLIGEILRKIVQGVKGSKSAVFVISQTRDAIGVMFGDKKTRSGGKALKFFSSHEIWMAVKAHIKRKERDVGVHVRVKISKNKITGKLRIVEFPIYYDYGVDDVTSCIGFLTDEGHWTVTKNVVNTKGEIVKEPMKTEALASFIAANPNQYKKLVNITASVWRKVEDSVSTKMPPKYQRD
jgi:recombination protein RecA